MSRRNAGRVAISAALMAFLTAGSAWAAFQPLDGQVNNDPANGINPAQGVNPQDPAFSDVVGGSLTAGGKPVPWGIFTARTGATEQVFVRSFANGAWTTRGAGTVGGRSDAAPTFPASLNFQQNGNNPEAPSIDFAGAGRVVPWATWYEDSVSNFGTNQVFASRFDNTGGANQSKWIFGGQGRGLAGGTVPVPSLNIHTGRDAENPVVAGGAAVAGANPGPWITWQEIGNAAPGTGKDQIFVSKPLGPSQANCDGVKPVGVNDGTGHVPAVGGFCFNQVGIERIGAADPSLNVDRGRDGIEPDIAFTGTNDTVPWVVWYETGPHGDVPSGHDNEMVFAAKGTSNGAADGGFQWTAVGTGGTGLLDNTANGGACGASAAAEGNCSLNKDQNADAEDPRVAAGTMTPGTPTVPWIAWDENVGPGNTGPSQIFVARLVNGTHFDLANNGAPISIGSNPTTRPDITFSGNTP
jgi:hypothetical protein